VLLGAGDWRIKTEDRAPPPKLTEGAVLTLGVLQARVVGVSPQSERLLKLRFDAAVEVVWHAVYQRGVPVQYAHRPEPESLWSFQNVYSSRPWAAEHVSAGRALTWQMLLGLRRAGIRVVALDATLQLPERYEISAATASAVNEAVATGRRVIAVGTSVMRALESNATAEGVTPKEGTASLIIDGSHRLLASVVGPEVLKRASETARAARLQEHLWAGDAMLLLAPQV